MDPAAFRAFPVVEPDAALAETAHQAAEHLRVQVGDPDVGRLPFDVQRLARRRDALLDQAVIRLGGAVARQDFQRLLDAVARHERLGAP